jgi:hypothetical protein
MNACDEDAEFEGLGQIVVGSGFKTLEHILWTRTRREHEDGNVVARRAQLVGDLEAIDPRQHDVEHDGVIQVVANEQNFKGSLAALHGGDFVPLGLKVEQQTLRQVNLILDDQNSRHRKRW